MMTFINCSVAVYTIIIIYLIFYTKISKPLKKSLAIGFIILLTIGVDFTNKELSSKSLTCTNVKIKDDNFKMCLGYGVSCSIYNNKMIECVYK